MKKPHERTLLDEIAEETGHPEPFACVGVIAGVDESGQILVNYGQGICRAARLMVPLKRYELSAPSCRGREVLLNFDHDNREKPIIVGLMADPLEDLLSLDVQEDTPQEFQVDGRTVAITAGDEILLTCGQGSIRLTRDGKIILKGIEILSRAREANKIKGATIELN